MNMAKYTDMTEGLKAGMRRLASSVSVVSQCDKGGNRFAMTATSVTSLSDNPASLLVCINQASASYPSLKAGTEFCINVLSADQEEISNFCSGQVNGEERFNKGNWATAQGMPYLTDAQVNFFCKNDAVHEYGTHIIVVGKLIEVITADGELNPLLYADGSYKKL